ncbi:MAG: hypothetical protein U0228_23225 [Myxococcaceae bacterium]
MAQPAPNPVFIKQLVPVAVLEGLVLSILVVSISLGRADLNVPLHLGWFIGTAMLAGSGLALFVIRSAGLNRRQAAGEDVGDDERRGVLIPTVMLELGALAIAGIGPAPLAQFLGS